jgi:hypothetical protein
MRARAPIRRRTASSSVKSGGGFREVMISSGDPPGLVLGGRPAYAREQEQKMKKEVKSIAPVRMGIVTAVTMAGLTLVFGILGLVFGGMMGPMGGAEMGGMGYGMGVGMGGGLIGLLGMFVFTLISGFIGGAIYALIYNLVAGMVGGVIVELEDA